MIRRVIAIWQVSLCEIQLRALGFQRVAGALLEPPAVHLTRPWDHSHSPLNTVQQSARLPWSTCLTRTIVAASRLRRQGYPARLRIGTTHEPTFAAHAWLEIGDAQWSDHGHQPLCTVAELREDS
ncbi:MAG: lasso peptide biosynthesis B2 protein [Lysobacterales bacterium]